MAFGLSTPVFFFWGLGFTLVGALMALYVAWEQPRLAALQKTLKSREDELAAEQALHDKHMRGLARILYRTLAKLATDLKTGLEPPDPKQPADSTKEQLDFLKARITVYRVDNDIFVPMARYSLSKDLQLIGRDKYPANEGIISETWNKRFAQAMNLPHDRERWIERNMKTWAMSRESLEGMAFQPRSLMGMRIEGLLPASVGVGVVIVESEQPKALSARSKDIIESSPYFSNLAWIFQEVLECVEADHAADFRKVLPS